MKKNVRALLVILGLMVLSACGKEADDGSSMEVLPLLVELSVTEHAEVGETVKMEALVTYGGEKVEDADKVVYEVWEDGMKDDSIMIDSVNEKNGLYTAETIFEKDGLYHIQVHVDAKRLHSMPVKEVIIGEGPNSEGHDDEHAEEGHEHGQTDGFSLHFVKPEHAKAGTDTEMMTHLQIDGQPLENANVRYEVWGDSLGEKHLWIDATELKAGEYTASHSFADAGTYTVKIHVKDDNGLHEHEEFTFEVQ
ncbi:FixH family protein [Sporosarcina sp. FSL W8-0480]|uniref:FixH family protein n=1 Tax=Sporosarcina sp. FSL W8-0480 TaxID=2954701 RepID=UPI0030DB0095